MTDVRAIIADLEQQKSGIEAALAALRDMSGTAETKRRGRPPGTATKRVPGRAPKKHVTLSDEGRERLAASMRKQWAVKRAAAAGGKKRGSKRTDR